MASHRLSDHRHSAVERHARRRHAPIGRGTTAITARCNVVVLINSDHRNQRTGVFRAIKLSDTGHRSVLPGVRIVCIAV